MRHIIANAHFIHVLVQVAEIKVVIIGPIFALPLKVQTPITNTDHILQPIVVGLDAIRVEIGVAVSPASCVRDSRSCLVLTRIILL